MRNWEFLLAVALLGLGGPGSALGQVGTTVGPNPTGIKEDYNVNFSDSFTLKDGVTTARGWQFTSNPIIYDPNQGPMVKILELPSVGVDTNDTFWLSETLQLTEFQTPAFTDWHETVLTPEWWWTAVRVYDGNANPVPVSVSGLHGTTLDILFSSSFQPGSTFFIEKELKYTDSTVTFENVVVEEYPTIPEPTTIALLGLGLAGLGWSRRRVMV